MKSLRANLINYLLLAMVSQSRITFAAEDEFMKSSVIPESKILARLDFAPSHLKVNSKGNMLAFTPNGELGLRILDLKSGHVFEPSGYFVGPAFFWSPDGARLFFREIRSVDGQTSSWLRYWDVSQGKITELENFSGLSGFPTFDPRDNRWTVIYDKGVKSKKLIFPGNRLAAWQAAQRKDAGKWAMAPKGAAFLTEAGFNLQKLEDDGSGVESFDISPDGSAAAWATTGGKIFVSTNGSKAEFLDWGRDPKWHPERALIVYAGGRMVGNKAADYDIKIGSLGSKGSFLTATQHTSERWPCWSRDGNRIMFVEDGAREIREMSFQPSSPAVAKPVVLDGGPVNR